MCETKFPTATEKRRSNISRKIAGLQQNGKICIFSKRVPLLGQCPIVGTALVTHEIHMQRRFFAKFQNQIENIMSFNL